MRIHSFRLRLAVHACLLGGVLLASFGGGTYWLIRNQRLQRLDADLRAAAERESSRTRTAADWERIQAGLAADLGIQRDGNLLLLVQDAGGGTIYRSPQWPAGLDASRLRWPALQTTRRVPSADVPPPASALVVLRAAGGRWHVGLAGSTQTRIALAVDARAIDGEMRGIRNACLISLPAALVLIGFGAWIFSSRALRPLHKLTHAIERVTPEALDQRLSAQDEDDEFVALIVLFNRMLERLQRSFQAAQGFSANAAHEFKTPLAILQGQLERAIHEAEDGSQLQVGLTGILDEVRHLSVIASKLLLLSSADAGQLRLHRERFDLSAALGELTEDTRMLAPQLRVTADFPDDLTLQADGALLLQALHNFIGNAIKYNIDGGWLRIAACATPRTVEVLIANSSPGIPVEDRAKVFDRFYRANSARGLRIEGSGLGLSVSREIARAHGGDVALAVDDDGVVEVSLTLPLA